MNIIDPARAVLLKDTGSPKCRKSKTGIAEPSLKKLCTKAAESRFTQSNTNAKKPKHAKLSTGIGGPVLAELCTKGLEPMCRKSRIGAAKADWLNDLRKRESPKRKWSKTDNKEPILAKLCASNKESRMVQSVTERGDTRPDRFKPMTKSVEPQQMRLRTNDKNSSCKKSKVDVVRPGFAKDLTSSGKSGILKSKANSAKPSRQKL